MASRHLQAFTSLHGLTHQNNLIFNSWLYLRSIHHSSTLLNFNSPNSTEHINIYSVYRSDLLRLFPEQRSSIAIHNCPIHYRPLTGVQQSDHISYLTQRLILRETFITCRRRNKTHVQWWLEKKLFSILGNLRRLYKTQLLNTTHTQARALTTGP